MSGSENAQELPLISIAIPVFNEADNLARLYDRLCRLASRMSGDCRFEFVFTDNHSTDTTWEDLTRLADADPRIKAIRFSKNVGFQRSILANYMHASGDAVLQIDADLQDPPELLEEFFKLWRSGYKVVYGIRMQRQEGAALNAVRRLGYWFIDFVSEHPIPRDAGDFRLVDRTVLNALLKFRSSSPYLRGIIAGLGFRQVGVPYARDARIAGHSKFGMSRLIRLGLTAIFNHSTVPLRIASMLGIAMLIISLAGAIYYFILKVYFPSLPQGLASIHILVLFGIGLQSFLLGMIGEYLLRIFLMMRAEPVAIVEQSLNMRCEDMKL